jgi:hypothetical protein
VQSCTLSRYEQVLCAGDMYDTARPHTYVYPPHIPSRYLSSQSRRAEGSHADLVPWLADQAAEFEAAAVAGVSTTPPMHVDPRYQLFSNGTSAAPHYAAAILQAAHAQVRRYGCAGKVYKPASVGLLTSRRDASPTPAAWSARDAYCFPAPDLPSTVRRQYACQHGRQVLVADTCRHAACIRFDMPGLYFFQQVRPDLRDALTESVLKVLPISAASTRAAGAADSAPAGDAADLHRFPRAGE